MELVVVLFLMIMIPSSYLALNVESYAPPTGFTITCYGYARDLNTNALLSGATVTLSEAESGMYATTTTKGGYYSISLTVPFYMKFTLRITMTGYNPASATLYSPGTYRKDLYLQPMSTHTVTCYGNIIDTYTTDPISDAIVVLYDPAGGETKTTKSDPFGWYYVSLATTDYKNYNLQASKTNYYTQTKSVYSNGNHLIDFSMVSVTHSLTISGIVNDEELQTEINNAVVKLYDDLGNQVAYTTTDYGYFTININTPRYGYFRLVISKTGYMPEERQIYSEGSHSITASLLRCLKDDFEGYTIGTNPYMWRINELEGISEVEVVDSTNEGLIGELSAKAVKMEQFVSGDAPYIDNEDALDFNHEKPLLLSFKWAYRTNDDEGINYGYCKVFTTDVYQLINIIFSIDGIYVIEGGSVENIKLLDDITEGQMYQIDIIFQKEATPSTGFTIYINKELMYYGSVAKNEHLSYVRFGAGGFSHSSLYADNIYFGYVNVGSRASDVIVSTAYPFCKMISPAVQGVESRYIIRNESSIKVTISASLGLSGQKGSYSGGFEIEKEIYSFYYMYNEDHFVLDIDNDNPDTIVFWKTKYKVNIQEILIPGGTDTYLGLYTDLRFEDAYYTWASEEDYNDTYGNPIPYVYTSDDFSWIADYTMTDYEQDYGEYMVKNDEQSSTNAWEIKGGAGVGFLTYALFSITVKATFSNSYYTATQIVVDVAEKPVFQYGRPSQYLAFLNIQPYKILAFGGGGDDGSVNLPASITPISTIVKNNLPNYMIANLNNLHQIYNKEILTNTTQVTQLSLGNRLKEIKAITE